MPLNTRAGVAQAPIEPGARCFLWLPCDAPWPLKLWRFIAPAKPLPFEIAGDVDAVALGEHVDHDRLADLEVGEVVDPQLDEVLRRLDAAPWRSGRARAC